MQLADQMRRLKRSDAGANGLAEQANVAGRYFGTNERGRRSGLGFFRPLPPTRQWAESNYDRIRRSAQTPKLVPVGAFWKQLAQFDGDGAFVSSKLLLPTETRASALIALATTTLPFESEVDLPSGDDNLVFTPAHPVAVITEQLREVQPLEGDSPILVGQRFEATTKTDDEQELTIAPEEFLLGKAYRGQIVLTNPTPMRRHVRILWQIPSGSLALDGGRTTDSREMDLEPFATNKIEYTFYFPSVGKFRHYPVHVSAEGASLASGAEREFVAVLERSQANEQSWEFVAEKGSAEQISTYLADTNLKKVDWVRVAHRMRDRDVYDAVMRVLETHRIQSDVLWAYALHHQDADRIGDWLAIKAPFVRQCGPVLHCSLLTVDPIERGIYEHLEYSPLVRGRIHPLRSRPEIMNDRLLSQYRSLMNVLAYRTQPETAEQLALCYYMVIQNRIEEALARFAEVTRDQTASVLQYDYLDAYLAMYRQDYDRAQQIADQYGSHPIPRWRQRYREISNHLEQRLVLMSSAESVSDIGLDRRLPSAGEADLAQMDRQRSQTQSAAGEPAIQLTIEKDDVLIDYQNVSEARINFYSMDLELLFSKTPFVQNDIGRLATIEPNATESLSIEGRSGTMRYALNRELARQSLLIEVAGDGARKTVLYYGGDLATHVSDSFGQIQVLQRSNRHPVTGAYVKVYARHGDGSVRFYKDGYTDLRGRFDYASLSTSDLATAKRLAILVLAPELGATIQDVAPPTK